MKNNKKFYGRLILFLGIVLSFLSMSIVSAFEFNGTVKDTNGILLNNSLINITVRNVNGFTIVGYNFTTTNASGWFNLSVSENANWMYEPKITWTNLTVSAIEKIGQSLPAFPQQMLSQVAGTTFFLREGGTINITAINSTGARISFRYQIKDQKLGYPIAQNFDSSVNEAAANVPRNRNYSIMIFPDASMPVSFDWNNFTATQSYNISDLSNYNFTTKTLHYQFNTTMTLVRVSGFINHSGVSGWNEFTVVPYLLEPGNMVHSKFGSMPYNLSAFNGGTDFHNLTNGFYNISLPSTPAETSNILLFAAAKNGSNYYGGFRNISSLGSNGLNQFNFSAMSGLFGSAANLSMENITGGQINISTAKQTFNMTNSTNSILNTIGAHIEVTVDYSSFGAIEFTWMSNINQGENSAFFLPLLNSTGVKEMNIFAGGGNYAPVRKSYKASQLANTVNITLNSFNPNAIDSVLEASSITMALYISNSTCDLPNPDSPCLLGGSQNMGSFNPMSAIMGGGKLSFRMGVGNIAVHYVNVDMMASGPPDALFDSSTTEATSGTFQSALRFGSGGPTVYDYVLVSIPYTQGSTSQTGLDESSTINTSMPLLYDDNWNIIWNSTANGTNAGALAGNNSHYSARQSEWAYLLNQSTCGTNQSTINASSPCYIDTANNKIWIRLPHFSGTGPSITGNVITASPSSSSGSSSSSGGGGDIPTLSPTEEELAGEGYQRTVYKDWQIAFNIENAPHILKVENITETAVKITISSETQEATLLVGEEKKFELSGDNYYDLSVRLNSINIINPDTRSADITIKTINEEIISGEDNAQGSTDGETKTEEKTKNTARFLALIIAAVIILILSIIGYKKLKK